MKLEVEMYVRTKRRTLQPPQIARIINISKDVVLNQYFIELDKNLIPSYKHHIYEEDIENASHNIIDLIEVGDVIIDKEGHKYPINYEFETDYNNEYESYEITIDDHITLFFKDCLSIVTKEQMEAMQYKVV